jgi:benzoyl-CoA reductase/2-hydroxyglutaryl-CoA dehydratase subunit BcrC/BadD/HgdB
MGPFEIMESHYRKRDVAALEWKKKGGKVAGYFCIHVPEELIAAAGLFPLRLSGDPWAGTDMADTYTMPVYEGFVRSMLQMILTGRYDFLDFLIIPHSRDAIEALHSILYTVKQLEPSLNIPELYLFDVPHTRFWLSGRYFYERVCEFKKKLEIWSEREITDESISRAIRTYNEHRRLLKRVAALRIADPPRISGKEALQIIGSSMFILKDEHNCLVERFLDGADWLPSRDGVRIFVEASPLDNLQFYEILEGCSATVVSEDNCWGDRYSDTFVDESSNPLEALTARYHLKSPCPRMYPISSRVDYCMERMKKAKAKGVVFYIMESDYAQTWEYPDQEKALREAGVSTLCFKRQKYLIPEEDKKRMKMEIERFVRNLG